MLDGAHLTLRNLELINGAVVCGDGSIGGSHGGSILARNGGVVRLFDVHVRDSAALGAAVIFVCGMGGAVSVTEGAQFNGVSLGPRTRTPRVPPSLKPPIESLLWQPHAPAFPTT